MNFPAGGNHRFNSHRLASLLICAAKAAVVGQKHIRLADRICQGHEQVRLRFKLRLVIGGLDHLCCHHQQIS